MIADEISKRRSRTLPIGHATGTRQPRGIMTPSELRPETNALAARSLLERVTGIEPALSAWESVPSGPVTWPDLRGGMSAGDRERPLVTGVNGTLMARRTRPRQSGSEEDGISLEDRKRCRACHRLPCRVRGPAHGPGGGSMSARRRPAIALMYGWY